MPLTVRSPSEKGRIVVLQAVTDWPEYDRVDLRVPTPHPLQVIFHSPIRCTGQGGINDASDVTDYTTPSGAAVFDSGTSKWECALDDEACGTGWGDPATFKVVREVTRRLLVAATAGPIGHAHPAVDTIGGPPAPATASPGSPEPAERAHDAPDRAGRRRLRTVQTQREEAPL